MIKAAQDAYLAGRQAAMEKLATTGRRTTKNLPAPGSSPKVSYEDSYLGTSAALAAAGLGGLGASIASDNPFMGAAVGAGILGAYTPTLLGAHRAKKMLEREGLSPEEIHRRAPEVNAFSPIGNLGTAALGSGIGAALGAGLAQFNVVPGFIPPQSYFDSFEDDTRRESAMEEAQQEKTQKFTAAGAGLGGLLGLGYGLYKDYANPMNEAQRIIDEAKPAR